MTNPNSEMTSFVLRETLLAHLLLWGNAYCQIIRSSRSQTLRLYPLLPDRMEVDRDNVGTLTYTYSTGSGQRVNLRPEDVLHIPGLGFDRIMGYSPIVLERMPSVWDSPPKNLNKLGSTYERDVVCTALPISCRLASSSCPCPALPYLWPVSRQ